ncbi:hypothetical protein HK096_009025, partial [Nowakowskiella sp. JEL0078]
MTLSLNSQKKSLNYERDNQITQLGALKLLIEREKQNSDTSNWQGGNRVRENENRKKIMKKSGKIYKIRNRTQFFQFDPTLLYPVQPWKTVKTQIGTILSSKSESNSNSGNFSQDLENETDDHGNPTPSSSALAITIPHGFQLIRSLPHPRPTIRSVLYVPPTSTSERFISLDSHNVNVWRGATRVHKISTTGIQTAKNDLPLNLGGTGKSGVFEIGKWMYIKSLKIYIAASTQLELRVSFTLELNCLTLERKNQVLDSHFEEISKVSTPKPVLSLEVVEDRDFVDIIAGEVGGIRIWRIKTETWQNHDFQ